MALTGYVKLFVANNLYEMKSYVSLPLFDALGTRIDGCW